MSFAPARGALAVALALIAGASLWWGWSRLAPVIALERDLGAGAPTLPPGATASGAVPAASPAARDATAGSVRLVEVAAGFRHPLYLTHAGDGSGRLFVVEQTGTIQVLRDGRRLAVPYLDLSSEIDTASGERGLLGLAFAPDFATSGRLFVAHTAPGPVVRLARYRAAPAADRADPGSKRVLLEMADPAGNHNGGMLAFGPDGFLYHGTGDGGSAGDPWDNARDRRSLLGKMLRLDVSGDGADIPPDNPFGKGGGQREVWAFGLRNPWRFSFDRATGELWIGDVGQNAWEEIDVVDSRRGGGAHFGWKTMEGFHCYTPREGCDTRGLAPPIHAYGRADGCSVTGGYVYRGLELPGLIGAYLFGDYCTGKIWTLRRDSNGKPRVALLLESGVSISSFGEDEAGEVYVCDHLGGRLLRLSGPDPV